MPSLFSWTAQNKYARQRTERQMRRQSRCVQPSEQVPAAADCSDIAAEVIIDETVPPVEVNNDDVLATDTITSDAWSQTDVDVPFDIAKFMFDDEAIHYYTGLENYSKVMFVLSTLGHAAYN